MDSISQKLEKLGILPVVSLANPQRDALPLAEALIRGGLPAVEVTFRMAGAAEAIQAIRSQHPDMLVGAGTVLTAEQVDTAHAAGAQFVVSPGFSLNVVKRCQELGLTVYPGCATATEIQTALDCGLQVLKFFPAETFGGVAAIKAIAAPFPMVRFMPTGGVSLDNLGSYLKCKPVFACGGSYITSAKLVEAGAWDTIAELCRKSLDIVKEVRGNG